MFVFGQKSGFETFQTIAVCGVALLGVAVVAALGELVVVCFTSAAIVFPVLWPADAVIFGGILYVEKVLIDPLLMELKN